MNDILLEMYKKKIRERKFFYTLHAHNEALNDGINLKRQLLSLTMQK